MLSACPTEDVDNNPADLSSTDPVTERDVFEVRDTVETDGSRLTGTVNGYVFLSGQADHTGISVSLDGLTGLEDLTDSTGLYEIELVPEGVFTATASLLGYEEQTSSPFMIEPNETETLAPMTLDVALGSLSGAVLLEDEIDHTGTIVVVRNTSHACLTNSAGEWLLEGVAAGNYAVEASHDEFVTISVSDQEVTAGLTTQVPTITLPREPGSISGQVTLFNAADFSAATVVATANWDDSVTCNGITNTEGYYSTDACPAGTYTVVASRPTYFSSARDDVVVVSGELTPNLDFVLDPVPDELNCNTTCGTCDTGLVHCDGETAECVGDLGAAALNPCGGCSELAGHPQTVCDFGQYWACDGAEAVACLPPQPVEPLIRTRFLGTSATHVAVVGDLDSDGLPEVLLASGGGDSGGDALIFNATDIIEPPADGILRPADAMIVLEQVRAPIELIDDLEGDGLPEIIALESGTSGTDRTLLFRSSLLTERTSIDPSDAHATFALRASIIHADGNLDGDIFPDVLLSNDSGGSGGVSYFISGSQLAAGGDIELSDVTIEFTGRRPFWAPDLDSDGRAEVIIADRYTKTLHVYFSSELVADVRQPKRVERTMFRLVSDSGVSGISFVRALEDYNGDGDPEIFVGAIHNFTWSSLILSGRDVGLIPQQGPLEPWRTLVGAGSTVSLQADRDGDGLAELTVAAPWSESSLAGGLFVIGSSTLNLLPTEQYFAAAVDPYLPTTSSSFGQALAVADIDGNGLDDLIVGAREEPEFEPIEDVVYFIPNRLTCEETVEPSPCEPLICEAGLSACSAVGEAVISCDEAGLTTLRHACALDEACEEGVCELATLELESGNEQDGKHGEQLDLPLVVRFTSDSGRSLADVEVTWSSPTDAAIEPTPSFTDTDGFAAVNVFPGTNPDIDAEQVIATIGTLTIEFTASVSGAFISRVEPWPINVDETTTVHLFGAGFSVGSHVLWDGPTGIHELTAITLESDELTINIGPAQTSQAGAVTVEVIDTEGVRSNSIEIAVSPIGYTFVPSGRFTMGSPITESGRTIAETPHDVWLTHGVFLLATEVTQDQWVAVLAANPSPDPTCGGDCPITGVTFWSVLEYLNNLSVLEGFESCYSLLDCLGEAALGTLDCSDVEVVGGDPYLCTGYRLPTEAEWEYSVRAGTTSAWYCGNEESCIDDIAWHGGNSDDMLHAVGELSPNAWGLYDMAGNVREMVWDYEGEYAPGFATDPIGPNEPEDSYQRRVSRGGAYRSYGVRYLRSAERTSINPSNPDDDEGFRIARTIVGP